MAILQWFDPFKADVVIATLPFISSGLWDSSINNLMAHCFWDFDWWSRRHTHTDTHTQILRWTLMMWNHFHFSLQILRRADKNGKYYTKSSFQTLTRTLVFGTTSTSPFLMCENRCTFSMKFWSWISADTRSVSMETGNWPCPLRFSIRTLTKKNIEHLCQSNIHIMAVYT